MKLPVFIQGIRRNGYPALKTLRIMKITVFLMIAICMQVSAEGYSQKITISEKNTPLQKVFKEIEKQSGYVFWYESSLIASSSKVNVFVKNAELKDVLELCFANLPVAYSILGKTIVLKEKLIPGVVESDYQSTELTIPPISINGKVIDSETDVPLAGASILVKGTKNGASTNEDGVFNLHNVSENSILVISFTGYLPREIKVIKSAMLLIKMERLQRQIDDIIVTAYSTFKKETFTGTATTITKSDIQKIGTPNIFSIIQSLDASFVVTDNIQLGSNPNAVPEASIRGKNSITGTTSNPLVILNGFEISMRELYDIEIERIESINILKDATATALYGSRGANGVIQVETSLPKNGRLSVSYSLNPTVNFVDLSSYNLLNAREKLEYEKQAGLYTYKKTGDAPWDAWNQGQLDIAYYDKFKNVSEGVNTYWLSQPTQSVLQTNHNLTIGGGANNVRYQLTGNYADRQGTMKGAKRESYGASFRLEYRKPNKFTFANEASYSGATGSNSPYGSFSTYTQMNPYLRIFDEDGNYITRYENDVYNPLYVASLKNLSTNTNHIVRNNLSLDWFVNQDWRINGSFSLEKNFGGSDNFKSPYHPDYLDVTDLGKRGEYNLARSEALNYEGRISARYNRVINKNIIAGQVTSELKSVFNTNRGYTVTGFSTDAFIDPSLAIRFAEGSVPNTSERNIKSIGAVTALDYSYDLRYAAQVSLRLDGSSLFGEKERYQYFPAYGLRWNIDNESFFKGLKGTINRLSLRGTYGISSSQDFSSYQAISTYRYAGQYYYNTAVSNLVAYGNENLQWQKSKQLNLGFDIEGFRKRFGLTFNVYNKMNDGMVISVDGPPSLGFANYYTNIGSVKNTGFDVTFTALFVDRKNFTIKSTTTADRNTSKLLNLSPEYIENLNQLAIANKTVPLSQYIVGESIDGIVGVRSLGIDPANGKELFFTKDNKRTYIWDAADKVMLGNSAPKLRGNQLFDIFYKDFTLFIATRYSFGGDIYNSTLVNRVEGIDPRKNVDSRVFEDRWKTPGDVSFYRDIKELTTPNISSRFIQTENYFTVSNISLRYNDRREWLKKFKIVSLSYQIAVTDIARISNVEYERGTAYPFEKSITGSLRITF